MIRSLSLLLILLVFCAPVVADKAISKDVAGCYVPVDGGWQIWVTTAPTALYLSSGSYIGVVDDDARTHRRPLFPPANRSMVFGSEELARQQRTAFRPMVLAYNEPRFVVDLHTAGGLCGHLLIGLTTDSGKSKWFHQWSDLRVRYVGGRIEYAVRDLEFPGVVAELQIMPLAGSAGLLLKVGVKGMSQNGFLVWTYGGATGFMTNYKHDSKEYSFAPEQCADNLIRWENQRFTLVRDNICFIRGACSLPGDVGFGDPAKVLDSPAALIADAEWHSTPSAVERAGRVAVQKIRLNIGSAEGWIIAGRGGNIEESITNLAQAEDAARKRNCSIGQRIVIDTPDPYLNAAVPMMAFATEGIWGDSAILHGGWSWRQGYLGWRGWYGPVCYGWTDRVKHSIEQHVRLGLIGEGPDRGALGHMLERSNSLFYNMNEVFFDQVRQYFEYTNDLDLMRRIFPVLQGILKWENLRLQPGNSYLYESSLNTWISDSHWYIRGQCTQASAYMLNAYRFLAELAERLGENPAPFRKRSELIRSAMQQKLWMPQVGVFAEYLDTLGHRQLHTEPELPTIYHSAEFKAASPLQIYQMLYWADKNLPMEYLPGAGRAYWSSNWAPNDGRSYTHSTYELAYGEQLNLALTNYMVGRADEAYSLIRGTLCGIFNGPAPGGLACHMRVDGRQRANYEFADSISMWGRAIYEGLFGIMPKRQKGIVELSPQFPSHWPMASIKSTHFSYNWRRENGTVTIDWESPVETAVQIRLPLRTGKINSVIVNGKAAEYRVEAGVGLSWIHVQLPSGRNGTISVCYTPAEILIPEEIVVKKGDGFTFNLADCSASDFLDTQAVLSNAHIEDGVLCGQIFGEPGHRLIFLKSGTNKCPAWLALRVLIESRQPVPHKIWSPPRVVARNMSIWRPVDLSDFFNAQVPEVLDMVSKAAKPPPPPALTVNFNYWKAHITGRIKQKPSDAAWRKKVGPDQIGWTTDGIPFKSSKQGDNIAVVTLAGGFPSRLEIPVHAAGKFLYLMVSGITFPPQSHVVNLRVKLHYEDQTKEIVDLVNPFSLGDCWGTWFGRYHDTSANGFENIGGRFGPAGSLEAGNLMKPIQVDTEAHLIEIELKEKTKLQSLIFEAVANDVIFGLMGATILK